MRVMAFNGSPRKNNNTAELLGKALEGAASRGAETELVHLSDVNFRGCMSCFACKLKGGESYGRCALRDGLTPLLSRAEEADAVVIGSPNYIGSPSALSKAFLERFLYPYVVYDANLSSLAKKKPVGFIYVMGSSEAWMKEAGYEQQALFMEQALSRVFGSAEILIVNDVYQFDDYGKYVTSRFDPEAKAKRRRERFPIDRKNAFDLGVRLIARS